MAITKSSKKTMAGERRQALVNIAKFLGYKGERITEADAKIAAFLGVSNGFIGQVRRGRHSFSARNVKKIRDHLGGSVNHLESDPDCLLAPKRRGKRAASAAESSRTPREKDKAPKARKSETVSSKASRPHSKNDAGLMVAIAPTAYTLTELELNGTRFAAVLLPPGEVAKSVQFDRASRTICISY